MKNLYRLFLTFGFDPLLALRGFRGFPYYLINFIKLIKQSKKIEIKFPITSLYPCFADRFAQSGVAGGHYFHQDLLVARKIFENKPEKHIDVGSRIDGFIAHLAVFRKVEIFDIRKLDTNIKNVKFTQMNLMKNVSPKLFDYADSISSLHALEHFGLGRYGDEVDYNGYLIGLENLYKILKKNGKMYISVPIGPQRIEFDAHRVFSISHILDLFNDKYLINSFAYIDDKGSLHENVKITEKGKNNNFNCSYGCGIFEMTKL